MSETEQATPDASQPQRDSTGTLLNQTSTTDTQTETPSPTLLNETQTEKPTEPEGVPEKYEFKPPADWAEKGYELDDKILTEAEPLLREMGLSQTNAQKLVEFYAKQSMAQYENGLAMAKKQNEDWIAEANAHPDLKGKLGPGKDVNVRIGKVIDSLGPELSKGFRQAMDFTGVGNHPAFIRAFDKIAQQLTEGTSVTGGKPSPLGQTAKPNGGTPGSRIWPNLPSG